MGRGQHRVAAQIAPAHAHGQAPLLPADLWVIVYRTAATA
jgi:hypothetical protein